MSDVLENPVGLLLPKAALRVHLDIDITYEEANFIRETLIPQYNLREMSLLPIKSTDHTLDLAPGEISFESVDQIVKESITAVESEFYDNKLLLDIYNNL